MTHFDVLKLLIKLIFKLFEPEYLAVTSLGINQHLSLKCAKHLDELDIFIFLGAQIDGSGIS